METLKTYGAAWAQSENDTPCTSSILELETKLLALGFSPLRIGGRNHTRPMVDTLAIEMPNGHPLFINLQNSFANRQKGYIHFFCTMPANAKQGFICDAQEKSALVAPNNCSTKTLTTKKLNAIIEHHNAVLTAALTAANSGRALVAEWRERVKNSGLKVYESSVKAQGLDNVNLEVESKQRTFRITIGGSSDHPFISQTIGYNGAFSWDQFLKLCEFDEVKSWHLVDFTGLNFGQHGFLIFGSSRAVNSWCAENEKALGACGFIVNERREGSTCGHIIDDVCKRKVVAL